MKVRQQNLRGRESPVIVLDENLLRQVSNFHLEKLRMTHPNLITEQALRLFEILEMSVRRYGLRTTKAALSNAATNPDKRFDSLAVAEQTNYLRSACSNAGIDQAVLKWGNRVMAAVRGRTTLAGITEALSR